MRALALVGGVGHPAGEVVPMLESLFDQVEARDEVDLGLARLDRQRHDVLVVAALACTRRDGETLSSRGQCHIEDWLAAGGPLLVLHTGVVSFEGWDRWGEIVARRWDWDRSSHGPAEPLTVSSTAGDFTVVDEWYRDLVGDGPVLVDATVDDQPVAWRHQVGPARVAVDVLGHGGASYAVPGHRALLAQMVEWFEGARCATS